MKKLLILSVIIALNFNAFAQSPQKMSYQAVVRNASGVLQANQAVGMKISILQGSETGPAVYVETQTKTTNANGLVTLEIGSGTIVSGTFAGIDWSNGTYFIKTETDPTGGTSYTITGTSQILSVPYALYSKIAKTANYNDLTNKPTTLSGYGITDAVTKSGTQTITGTTTFKGTTPDMEEALFDVKNKDGQTIFAVYNEGVRIWVADGAKGSRGGFAVGGFDMTKGNTGNYFNISARSEADTVIGESRVMWYPVKEAFRAGNVLIESKDSVGLNSWASGYRSKAIGDYSQALGYQAIARGDYSTSIGKNAVSDSINSFAFGESASALKNQSYAFGFNARANAKDAFAFGRGAEATGIGSFALGFIGKDSIGNITGNTVASDSFAVAVGMGSKAQGKGSFAIGTQAIVTNEFSQALGYQANASGYGSNSIGYKTMASGKYATALGYGGDALGERSITLGNGTASGTSAVALGFAEASGSYSLAFGGISVPKCITCGTSSSGSYSVALGPGIRASSYNLIAVGSLNDAAEWNLTGWVETDPLFIIGNGHRTGSTSYVRSTAVTVLKNGNVGIGTTIPSQKLHVNGDIRLEGGGIQNLSGGVGVGFASTGWYSDAGNLATRIPSTTGDLYVQTPGGASTYLRVGPGVGGMQLFVGKAVFDNAVGIGTSNPGYKLDVAGNARIQENIQIGNSSGPITANWWEFGIDNGGGTGIDLHANSSATDYSARIHRTAGNNGDFNFVNVGTGVLHFYYNNGATYGTYDATGWHHTSDIRLKENIESLSDVLARLTKLEGFKFNFINDPSKKEQIGLIAQDVEVLFPELVSTDEKGYTSICYDQVSVLLIEALKEQQHQIDELKAMVKVLMNR